MQAVTTVTPPECMNFDWVCAPTDACASQYATYFRNRKLSAESEGWTSWTTRLLAKHTLNVIQVGATYVYSGFRGYVSGVVVRNDLVYHAAGKVVQAAHGVYVSWTRVPIDHDRVDRAVAILQVIGQCRNAQLFIDRIQEVYTKTYFASKGSSDLMNSLASDIPPSEKITSMIRYLQRLDGTNLYNNGKWLFQVIVCMAEHSTIVAG